MPGHISLLVHTLKLNVSHSSINSTQSLRQLNNQHIYETYCYFLFYANILHEHMNKFYIHEQIPSFSFEKTYTRLVRMVSGPMELSFAVDFPQIFLNQQSVSPL